MAPREQALMSPEGVCVWGGERVWEGGRGLGNQLRPPQGWPGARWESPAGREGPLLSAVLNSCRAQHYLDAVLEMDVLGLFLVLEYYGLCPEALPLRGGGGERGRKPGTPGVSQQKAPAPDTERLTVIFLLRKKKPFIILLGLSETIWADFSRPVFTCKSGRAYLSSPTHPYEPR